MKFWTLAPLAAVFALPIALRPVPALAQATPDNSSIWTLQDENASISAGTPTDRFYVNGLRLSWFSPTTVVPDFLADLGRTLWGPGELRVGVDLTQQIYTPANTSLSVPDPRDRPYAGVLLGNFSLLGDTEDTRSVFTISVGVVGPGSGAASLQNGFHDLIGQDHANGWDHQISNTPVFNVMHERTWRLPMGKVWGLETDALPSLTAAVGDLRDYIQTGIQFRIGQGLDSDFGVPRVRPGLSGGDVFKPTRPFAWYVFVGGDGQAVGYDLLLNSHPFRGGPHVNPIWDVGELQGGFAVMAYGMRLTFAYVMQTQEFEHQTGGLHQFGSAALSIRF
ncbi:MAG TPA: lipid A deacylase LpxR family protein [Rhodopila sp.]|uniref:lipid A deacylase LpxR family protein n=1 Tax=Rhodopila sp. TaxID=2480087 RepID=UPI002C89DB71|nr:lipid A deacylase LpxR family protein [Rhodopila sp.]HVY16591.1 lipid A deacylase LpxR family protein [Rhodopila sp.]